MFKAVILIGIFFIISLGQSGKNMVLIPSGSFTIGISKNDLDELVLMGKDIPHMNYNLACSWFGDEIGNYIVTVDSFYIDKYEVTNREFQKFVEQTGYKPEGDWDKYATEERMNHPVVGVTYKDALAYAKWAGKTLPTEIQWEYAALGAESFKWFPWGNSPDSSKANYRYKGESFIDGVLKLIVGRKIATKPVGSFLPNGYGIFDICGNVSEWCLNDYLPYKTLDEKFIKKYHLFEKKDLKSIRGGNWNSPNAVFVRMKNRKGYSKDFFSNWLGFRCVKVLK